MHAREERVHSPSRRCVLLEVVHAGIKERQAEERSMFSKAFAGPTPAEEARERRKAAEAQAARDRAEAELQKEWRAECARLRAAHQGSGVGATAWGRQRAEELSAEAAAGDAEAVDALDRLAPISLEDFKEAREHRMA